MISTKQMHHLVLNYQKISIKCLIPHEISEIIQSNTLFHMKLVKSSNQIPITAYACCKYHETTNYKVLQFLFNQSNCLITIKYSVQPIKLLNYYKILRSTNPMARSLYIYVIIIMNFLTLIVFRYL